jgi:hypothetical protein
MVNILFHFLIVHFFPSFISNTSMVSINFRANLDLRMQEMAFPCFKFQNPDPPFISKSRPPDPPFMRGILATHVAFSHCYPPLIYYLTERSLFKKCPPTGKSLKKALH